MELIDLYDFAEHNHIAVDCLELEHEACLSIMSGEGRCYIVIDPFKISSTADETYKLAHDLGHCALGAFYNLHSPCDLVGRHEHRADVWAIKKLLPKEELKLAINHGYSEIYDLAEHFNLPENLVRKALEYYQMVS